MQLPDQLKEYMENASAFKSQVEKEEAQHKSAMRKLQDDQAQMLDKVRLSGQESGEIKSNFARLSLRWRRATLPVSRSLSTPHG